MSETNTTAVAKYRGLVTSEKMKQALTSCLPKHMSADRFCQVMMTANLRTPKLALVHPYSLVEAMMKLSSMGLEPDGRNAHLVPFEDRKRKIVTVVVIPDYKGLVDIAMRSGQISGIHADVVCDKDVFDYDRGKVVQHRINFREPRGEKYAAYVIIGHKDGYEKCEVMGKDEIYLVRDKSQAWIGHKKYGGNTPWADPQSEPEMWKKTVFKRATKWIKMSPELAAALDVDDNPKSVVVSTDIDLEHIAGSSAPEESHTLEVNAQPGAETQPEDDVPMGDAPTQEPKRRGRKPTLVEEPIDKPEEQSIQAQLADIITGAGFTLDDFLAWGGPDRSGNISEEDMDKITSFDDVPTELATRMVRAKAGLLTSLKGGAK